MTAALYNLVCKVLSLSWLTGPIFDKELRVSSRRRRNYVLRSAYLAFMIIFLIFFWLEEVRYSGSSLYQASRMAKAGQIIVAFIVWFQFCATQAVAIVMLSTSISDEIYNRTLGLLMTTPISSFQIVTGKLFSKLLQLVLLLAISLPLLAIVRVFGGVPWDYVVSSLCMTLTTIIFVGSLSLFFSIFSRRAYVVIILTILTLAAVFALLPLGLYALWDVTNTTTSERSLLQWLFAPNPYCTMFYKTLAMLEPRAAVWVPTFLWTLNCGIILAASAVIFILSVIMVRRVALRQATGQLDGSARGRRSGKKAAGAATDRQESAAALRPVKGPPVIWKELRFPLLGRHKMASSIVIFAGLIILIISYGLCSKEDILDEEGIHVSYTLIFAGLGMLFTIVLPATCITSEKESRSWPLLLATTLDDKQILFGKLTGAFRRCLPAWVPLFGHIILFSFMGIIHPVAIILMAIPVTWTVFFLCCAGIYFSSCFRRTTTAVIMNLALAVTIWGIVPLLLAIIAGIAREPDPLEVYVLANPVVQVIVVNLGSVGRAPFMGWPWDLKFEWPHGNESFLTTMHIFVVTAVMYVSIGMVLLWRAKCRFRRNIF
jgi:ABC-2 type transport system permease protein